METIFLLITNSSKCGELNCFQVYILWFGEIIAMDVKWLLFLLSPVHSPRRKYRSIIATGQTFECVWATGTHAPSLNWSVLLGSTKMTVVNVDQQISKFFAYNCLTLYIHVQALVQVTVALITNMLDCGYVWFILVSKLV